MSLCVVVTVEVDPEFANDDRTRHCEGEQKDCKLDDLDHGYCLRYLVSWVQNFEHNKSKCRREESPPNDIIGTLCLLHSLPKASHSVFTSVKIYPHRDEAPLEQIDEVGDAQEQSTRVVEEADCLQWHVAFSQAKDVERDDSCSYELAQQAELQEDEVGNAYPFTNSTCKCSSWCLSCIVANMNNQPCQTYHHEQIEQGDKDQEANVASYLKAFLIHSHGVLEWLDVLKSYMFILCLNTTFGQTNIYGFIKYNSLLRIILIE